MKEDNVQTNEEIITPGTIIFNLDLIYDDNEEG